MWRSKIPATRNVPRSTWIRGKVYTWIPADPSEKRPSKHHRNCSLLILCWCIWLSHQIWGPVEIGGTGSAQCHLCSSASPPGMLQRSNIQTSLQIIANLHVKCKWCPRVDIRKACTPRAAMAIKCCSLYWRCAPHLNWRWAVWKGRAGPAWCPTWKTRAKALTQITPGSESQIRSDHYFLTQI